jgi:hypothetical protein
MAARLRPNLAAIRLPGVKTAPVLPSIHTIRFRNVVLDEDIARLYGVQTKRLNEAVRRNPGRFPPDFCFRLTAKEHGNLRSQLATSNGHGGRRYAPFVFTEHGALMAATVLNSPRAVEMSRYLIRAFVQMRETILANATILKRLAEIDRRLIEHDSVLREVIAHLRPLLDAPPSDDVAKPKIGFHRGNR